MPARRCPHCGLVNPGSAQMCDCGYSFVDGSPPRFSPDKPRVGGSSFASDMMTRLAIRGVLALLVLGGVVAIRVCS